jgi:hypothetical protein
MPNRRNVAIVIVIPTGNRELGWVAEENSNKIRRKVYET